MRIMECRKSEVTAGKKHCIIVWARQWILKFLCIFRIAHILLDQFEQDQVAALKKSQLEVEMEQAEADSSSDDAFEDDEGYSTKETIQSTSFHTDQVDRALWGSTYRSDPVIGRTRWKNKHSGKENDTVAESTLSPEEKLLLINEFTSSMFSSFLLGNDDFDYRWVFVFNSRTNYYEYVMQCWFSFYPSAKWIIILTTMI